jgi:oxygen-independent coproporphyrinogen-3 oxidase
MAEHEAAFVSALEREVSGTLGAIEGATLHTVFLGGGTPSVLAPRSLERVFDAFAPYLDAEKPAEITVEVNPEDVTPGLLAMLRGRGVNRVSLGVQSMDEVAQKVLRRCAPARNREAIELVRGEFDNVSFDVLVGVPGSSPETFAETLRELADIRPEHFSVYCLEPGGDMSHEVEKFFTAVDPSRSADEYHLACELLADRGYRHYEVSNFCLPGRASEHNRVYWSGREYVGVGPGAHSYVAGRRYRNRPSLADYLAHGGDPGGFREYDDGADEGLERMMLGLRTSDGVPRAWCRAGVLRDLADEGYLVEDGDRVRATDRGFLVLNEMVLRLYEADETAGSGTA